MARRAPPLDAPFSRPALCATARGAGRPSCDFRTPLTEELTCLVVPVDEQVARAVLGEGEPQAVALAFLPADTASAAKLIDLR